MDVPDPLKKLDDLAGKQLTKLVLIYDRSHMLPTFRWEHSGNFWLKTTEMPLHVLVHSDDDALLAHYSFNPSHKSHKTWTIVVKAFHNILFAILRKALTLNGPKYYNFHHVIFHMDVGKVKLIDSPHKDLYLSCQLDMNPPKVVKNQIKLGSNGEFMCYSAGGGYSVIDCVGYNTTYFTRKKFTWLAKGRFGMEIIPY